MVQLERPPGIQWERPPKARTPDADAPWHEIVPQLWMGGHHYGNADGVRVPAIVGTEFDVVISLFQADGHGPGPDVEHHHLAIPDAELRAEQLTAARELARIAAAAVRADRCVMVRCQYGYNRSGLVVAQTLLDLGHSVDDAIALIRLRRSRYALNNEFFVNYLTIGLDGA
ncbi:protein-tyrosine phosphatase family protein [Nocardia sp. CA-135398]|uniref:protein-tyrosine phosphatase family protein n=1 Tax=Nocardia sp. CA-135398 TaxID=3239977 RepID=UPI003D9897BB